MFLATFTYDEPPFYDYYFAPPQPTKPSVVSVSLIS